MLTYVARCRQGRAMTDTPLSGWIPDHGTFGARLAAIRQALGWGNVAEAARACDLPVSSWRNWERDGRLPFRYRDTCELIAAATGVDLDWLLGPEGRQLNSESRPGRFELPIMQLRAVPPGAVDHRFSSAPAPTPAPAGRRSRFATSVAR